MARVSWDEQRTLSDVTFLKAKRFTMKSFKNFQNETFEASFLSGSRAGNFAGFVEDIVMGETEKGRLL